MNIILFIKARKIIFLRTILAMEEYMPIRKVLIAKINSFVDNDINHFDSPITQILCYCAKFRLLDRLRVMASNDGIILSKAIWKKLVWERAWDQEKQQWDDHMANNHRFDLLKQVSTVPQYSIWWMIADVNQSYMRKCEIMIKILCHTSMLKCDDSRMIRATFSTKSCIMCDNTEYEDARHMIIQCSAHSQIRRDMYTELHSWD